MKKNQNKFEKTVSQKSKFDFLLKYSTIIFIVVGFILYAQTLKFDYTNLDDKTLIADDKDFVSHFSNIPKAFNQDVFRDENASFYRPVFVISLIIDATIGKMSLAFFHFTNIIFHILSVCLLFHFLIQLKIKEKIAFLFSLLFLVHPALTQAVAWIPGRNDSLLAVFVLLSFLMLVNYIVKGKNIFFLFHVLFFLLALLTKETAVVLPMLYFLLLKFIYKKNVFSKSEIRILGSWFISLIVWYIFRNKALHNSIAVAPFQFLENIPSNASSLLLYIGKVLLPINLSVMPIMIDNTILYGVVTILILAGILFLSKIKISPIFVFGLFWVMLFLIPMLVVPKESAYYYEHRLYLPIMGMPIIFGQVDLSKTKNETIFNSILISLVILFAVKTFLYSKIFSNKNTFWGNAIETSPHSWYANKVAGSIYLEEKGSEKAKMCFIKATELNPSEPAINNDLGLIYRDENNWEKAIACFEKEVNINRKSDKAFYNLAHANYQIKNFTEAEKYWMKTIAINPNYTDAYQSLAIVNVDMRNIEKARFYAHEAEKRGVVVPDGFWNMIGR